MRLDRHRGFTLIEVLIALAVLAIALTAVMRAMAQTIDTSSALRERTLALWLAQDRLVTHRLTSSWPGVDTIEGEAEMGPQKFRWREQVLTTPVPEIRRIEIEVRGLNKPDVLAHLSGYVRDPGKQ
jgi:general secretion pathway protein I